VCADRTAELADLDRDDGHGDRDQALETARLILGKHEDDDEVRELVAITIQDVEADMRGAPRRDRAEALERQLVDLRVNIPVGVVVLDSRQIDELLGDIAPLWRSLD
jgi:hypothetical protein